MALHPPRRGRRIAWIVAGAVILLAMLVALALHAAAALVKTQVLAALGPDGSAAAIDVGFSQVELSNVILKAPASLSWPARETLTATRVVLQPDFFAALSHRTRIHRIDVYGAYLSVLRTADGKISLLPNLQQSIGTPTVATQAGGSAPRETDIGEINFHQSRVDFFDGTVAASPYRLTLDNIETHVGPLNFPMLTTRTVFHITGGISGAQTPSSIDMSGWIVLANKDSQIHTVLRSVDVGALRPYIAKGSDADIESGTLDLDMTANTLNYRIHAPGTLTLNHLQFKQSDTPLGTLLAVPRKTVLAALKNKNDQLVLHFELDGDLRDPHFSLNEGIAKKLGAGLAQALGVGAKGVAEGVGATTKGIGGALLNLIGK
ncbi:MAG: DUF748 domain-containing protein [Janthinobacterium lividum]